MALLGRAPVLPDFARRRYAPRYGPWHFDASLVPDELRSVPGIRRDPEAERAAFEAAPLYDFVDVHRRPVRFSRARNWRGMLWVTPRNVRVLERLRLLRTRSPGAGAARVARDAALTRELRERADALGLSAIGIAPYDEKYQFVADGDVAHGDTIVVCALEQNYERTQTIPSVAAEKAALNAYVELMKRMAELTTFLHDRGHQALPQPPWAGAMVLHYAVQSGLGQLGMNGQVLTPVAGSRCRFAVIATSAPLVHDEPVDYGIEGLCDRCQVCVRRCPPGAIPVRRRAHRGVVKTKLNTARCWPVVAQAHGCAVCMKVCPVQKYGLADVLRHYAATGEVLGKGSDDLEAYDWIDGNRYPAGVRPRLRREFVSPPSFGFDPSRTRPPEDVAQADHSLGI